MIFINSSIVIVSQINKNFVNHDLDGATRKQYQNKVNFEFDSKKLKFQIDMDHSLLNKLSEQVIGYCGKYNVYDQWQAVGINFLVANIDKEYDDICAKFIKNSLPKFENLDPIVQNISLQYKDLSNNRLFNIKIQKAEDEKGIKKPMPFFDLNVHYDLHETSIDKIKSVISNVSDLYHKVGQFIGGI